MNTHEIQKEIYKQVIDVLVSRDENDLRLWDTAQTLFECALSQLDPENSGMVITYAKLLPARADGYIHALREAISRGHYPWPHTADTYAFLGSMTLAGQVIMLQHTQAWSDEDQNYVPVQVDKYERSACAAPLMRGSKIAGIFLVSSTQPRFFNDTLNSATVNDYARLFSLAIPSENFRSPSIINLRPMADLENQRARLNEVFMDQLTNYITKYGVSRHEAEHRAEQNMETEFEQRADETHKNT
ncbi:MAG TPA: hypothetical protein VHZ51_28450 [Ktedonobacteraceae bacterium]|jgi:transcriptional regulator with GAF, ATPase, and Fis domain|nr:hypothetical protein [Ktedonobacteraceae bacterium]